MKTLGWSGYSGDSEAHNPAFQPTRALYNPRYVAKLARAHAMTDERPTPPPVTTAVVQPRVGIIMGSRSDWATMHHAADVLTELDIPHEVEVVSAHRTPDKLFAYAEGAEARGIEVIIAGAGGAAHLPGMCAAKTILPVLGVPVESAILRGVDSLLSIVQMPAGVAVGTLAVGKAGAINAALLAAAILGLKTPSIREALRNFRNAQTQEVLNHPDPRRDS